MDGSQPLPPPLMVSEPGSFAEHTIAVRKPQIVADVLDNHDYPPEIVDALHVLVEEIATGRVAPLAERHADAGFWLEHWRPHRGRTWRELPWFFAETYFYRRLLEATRYFQPGPWRLVDPFGPQKADALLEGLEALAVFYAALPEDLPLEERFRRWLLRSLWGNRADLSNVAVSEDARAGPDHGTEGLLVDHSHDLWALFRSGGVGVLDWAADNCGLELLSDLGMVDLLLSHRLVERVRLHLKPQPYFVSDAMPQDAHETIEALAASDDEALAALGSRLASHRSGDRLALHTDPFWASCLFFTQMPGRLRSLWTEGDLILLKGDVNYRRLLEDRHWPPDTPLERITRYMPQRFVALRTLKGELIAGLPTGKAAELAREDPSWLINGRRGLIHLVHRP